MIRLTDRHRLYIMIAAVAASVFLFACGARDAATPDSAAAPGSPAPQRPSEAPVARIPAPVPAPQPALAAAAPAPAATEQPAEATSPQDEAEEMPGRARAPAAAGAGRVFTNKDLERYRHLKQEFGFRDDVQVVDLTRPESKDVEGKTSGMTAAERDAELAQARERINQLARDLEYERKRILPLENPFVPAPQIAERDKVAEAGMNNRERLDRVKQRIAAIESEIGTLQRRIAELQSVRPSDEPEGGATAHPPDRE